MTSSSIDLVVFLHGVGSSGADLARLGPIFARKLPNLGFAAPDGPEAFDQAAMGRQWFSVLGVTVANRPARVAAAAPAFDAVVDAAIAAAGTGVERTVLAGFSQGTIMALDAVARGRRFAGVIGWSGRMASAPTMRLDGFPVRLAVDQAHGEADGVIPVTESDAARDRLVAAGAVVDVVRLPGEGHGIGPAAVAAGIDFLARLTG